MGISGPPPKEDPIRPNKATFDKTEIWADGVVRGPELPTDVFWHPITRQWYHKWRVSAQSTVMEQSDWDMLIDTALLHHHYWADKMSAAQRVALAGEIRQRTATIGSTFEARLKLRMVIRDDAPGVDEDDLTAIAQDGIDYFEKLNRKAAELAQEAKEKD